MAKYRAASENRARDRDKAKPVYAFGSSTPRVLAYLQVPSPFLSFIVSLLIR